MERIKHYFMTALHMLRFEVQSQLEYPARLLGWAVTNSVQILVGVGFLKVITTHISSINGWTFEQMVFLYGIGVISHGLCIIFFIQTWQIDWFVINGEFDRMLLRPMNVYFQFCVNNINLVGFTDLIPGIIIFIYGSVTSGFSWTFKNTLLLLITIIGATLIRAGIFTIVGSTGFWTKSSDALIDATLEIFDNSILYPMSIYNKLIQGIFTFLMPIAFFAFYPASYFLGVDDMAFHIPGSVPLWCFIIGVVMLFIGSRVFKMGLKRYDSAGN